MDQMNAQVTALVLEGAGGDINRARQMVRESFGPTQAQVGEGELTFSDKIVHVVDGYAEGQTGQAPLWDGQDYWSPDMSTFGHYDWADYDAGTLTWTENSEVMANANAALDKFDRQVAGVLLGLPLLGAAAALAPVAASVHGMGTTGFYLTTLLAGTGIGGATEYSKNMALDQQGTLGGYVSSAGFGALGSTFSVVGAGSKYVMSLSRYSGVSTERLAAAGNGFAYGFAADATKQRIDIMTGEQVTPRDTLQSFKSGLFGALGGAALPQYYGIGAQDKMNISTFRGLWSANGARPAGASPLLIFKAEGATQLPVAIMQPITSTAAELSTKVSKRTGD
jgi:hypothetical protein